MKKKKRKEPMKSKLIINISLFFSFHFASNEHNKKTYKAHVEKWNEENIYKISKKKKKKLNINKSKSDIQNKHCNIYLNWLQVSFTLSKVLLSFCCLWIEKEKEKRKKLKYFLNNSFFFILNFLRVKRKTTKSKK